MGKHHERKGKDCLNCHAVVHGRFCSVCGQENLEPAESAWHLVTHFFNDITHFDGKFFTTIRPLITRPGFLSLEYKRGRRASYLNPIRMYLFTSAIFFFIFFSLYSLETEKMIKKGDNDPARVENKRDSTLEKDSIVANDSIAKVDSTMRADSAKDKGYHILDLPGTLHEYDSLVKAKKRENSFIERFIMKRQEEIYSHYGNDKSKLISRLLVLVAHSFPQILFISLPLLALFFKLIYMRKKGQHYYVAHGIFTIHLYIFIFFVLFAIIVIDKGIGHLIVPYDDILKGFLIISIFYYIYRAMRVFYGQGRRKTIFKFFLVLCWMLTVFIILFLIFMLISLLKV